MRPVIDVAINMSLITRKPVSAIVTRFDLHALETE